MGGARRDARFGLDVADDVETEASGEVRPGVVIRDELDAGKRREYLPHRLRRVLELAEESLPMGGDRLALSGCTRTSASATAAVIVIAFSGSSQ